MTTTYASNVYRATVTATRVAGAIRPAVLAVPSGVTALTIYAYGSTAAACKIEETADTPALAFATPTGGSNPNQQGGDAWWLSVDSTLDAVGTTKTRYLLGDRTPVAIRAYPLLSDQTATLVLVGRRS